MRWKLLVLLLLLFIGSCFAVVKYHNSSTMANIPPSQMVELLEQRASQHVREQPGVVFIRTILVTRDCTEVRVYAQMRLRQRRRIGCFRFRVVAVGDNVTLADAKLISFH